MNSNTLTNKQLMILEFIKEQLLSKGYPPSVREICQAVGLKSTSTVHSHLNKLEKLGYIRRDPTKPRAIEILDGGNVFVNNNNTMQEMINLPPAGRCGQLRPHRRLSGRFAGARPGPRAVHRGGGGGLYLLLL